MTTEDEKTTTTTKTTNENAPPPPPPPTSTNSKSTDSSMLDNIKTAFQKIKVPTVPDTNVIIASLEESTPHLKHGLAYSVAGAAVGGAVGMLLFRSGTGMRAASVACGTGVAFGSTLERIATEWQQQHKKE